jgi:hypothetical protein
MLVLSIEDVAADFFSFWEAAADAELAAQRGLWKKMYEDRHQEIFDLYYRGLGERDSLDRALERFPAKVAAIAERWRRTPDMIRSASRQVTKQLRLVVPELRFVIFVGLFGSNGWVGDFRGGPTTFLAVERLPDPPGDEILIAHECAHQLHRRLSTEGWDDGRITHLLFQEGLATAVSEEIVPGRSEAEYLWFEGGFTDWLGECRRCWPSIRRELVECAEGRAAQSPDRFFSGGGTRRYSGELPERAGYFAARRVMREIQGAHPLSDVMRWSANTAELEVRAALNRL